MATLVKTGRLAIGAGRWFAVQVTASVIAAVVASALFTSVPSPTPVAPVVSENGKSLRRVPDGAIEVTTLRYDPQQQAALASMASFTPAAVAATVVPAVVAAPRAPAKQTVSVLPPPRPALQIAAAPTPPKAEPAPEGWHVAGVEIPGTARVRRFVPTGADILKTGDAAWTASMTASVSALKKVAGLGGLLGL